eukprot:m.493213 g.493213  ORF g.493213 m.493213 type:complete len:71 (-) comp36077_c0_seq1:89-301(-)
MVEMSAFWHRRFPVAFVTGWPCCAGAGPVAGAEQAACMGHSAALKPMPVTSYTAYQQISAHDQSLLCFHV